MRRSRRSCGDVRIAWGRVFVRKAGSMLTVAMREQADPPAGAAAGMVVATKRSSFRWVPRQ